MATVMHAELGYGHVISTFGTTSRLQNAKKTQKIPSSATVLWVCVSIRACSSKQMNMVYNNKTPDNWLSEIYQCKGSAVIMQYRVHLAQYDNNDLPV